MFKLFKNKKQKDILNEIINTQVKEQATEAIVESIIQEVKKEEVIKPKKPNHFPDCNCFKCLEWKRNA